MNIFTDINIAAVKAEFQMFNDINKGIIVLIPAAVEAVKQETIQKIKLFLSDGKAMNNSDKDISKIVEMVVKQVRKNLNM